MAGIWDAGASSASPRPTAIKAANSHATPQASRFFFNSSPGWNIAESSSKPVNSNSSSNNNSNTHATAASTSNNGNSLKPVNSTSLFDMPAAEPPARSSAHDSTAQDFLNRYQQLKALDGYKNELIEELLYRYEFLTEQFRKVSDDHDREREYNRASQRREKALQENMRRLQIHLDRDPFVLVLIDGDGMIFTNELLKKGEDGGRDAAMLLYENIAHHLSIAMPDLQPDVRIVARVYANLRGLGEACYKAGIVDRPSRVEDFAKGFTSGKILFDFVDVGGGKDRADVKVSELFKLHLNDLHCRQIVFGCSHDNGYARLLEELATDQHARQRVTLLEGVPFERELKRFNLERAKFNGLFRESKINVYAQDALPPNVPFAASNGVSLPSSSPSEAVLSRQLSEVDINDVKDFTPRLPQARAASMSTDSAKPSPIFTWASAAAKPVAAIVPPPPAAPATPVNIPKDHIPRNRKGQRVDPIIKHDKAEVDRVKKLKMCNVHFLRGECPYGDSCSHVHQYKPTAAELQTLRLVARMAPCMHGSECEEPKCIYGHICPAPEGRDGKDCIFGEQCRFPAEMHRIDRQIVRTIKV